MSLMYPQNLMNSFLYRHTHSVESPLCQKCGREEETPYHVIWECSDHQEENRTNAVVEAVESIEAVKHKCEICDFKTNWKNSLSVHMTRKHSKIE